MSIKNLRLHHFPGVRSARVVWLLQELEQSFDIVPVNLFSDEQHSPSFKALNPAHAVPVLEFETQDGSAVSMYESGAIVSFLADLWPEAGLAPEQSDCSARSAYLQMIHFCAASIDMMLWQIRVNEHLLRPEERDEKTSVRYRKKFIAEVEPVLAEALVNHDHACSDTFSAADCMIGHAVVWARTYGLCSSMPFDDYIARCGRRPAFHRAFSDVDSSPRAPTVYSRLFNG